MWFDTPAKLFMQHDASNTTHNVDSLYKLGPKYHRCSLEQAAADGVFHRGTALMLRCSEDTTLCRDSSIHGNPRR